MLKFVLKLTKTHHTKARCMVKKMLLCKIVYYFLREYSQKWREGRVYKLTLTRLSDNKTSVKYLKLLR